jgi:hypothetical protein
MITTRGWLFLQEAVERGNEEKVKIVEVDDAGVAQGGRRSSCYSTTPGRTPAKAELYQKVSPTPSALTDASARTLSGRFDDPSFSSAWEPTRRGNAAWRFGPVRGRVPELHGEHDVVARQGAAVAERAEAAPLVGVRVRSGGLAVPVVLRVAAAEPGRERRRAAQGVAGPAGPAPELRGAHGAVPVAGGGAGPRERRRRRVAPRQRVRVVEHRRSPWQCAGGMAWMTI